MGVDRKCDSMRPLTKQEIDRQIEGLLTEVAGNATEPNAAGADGPAPRWITAAELVRRMSRFIVYN